jgi:hypothetical protein
VSLGARYHDHEVIRISDQPVCGFSAAATGFPSVTGCHVTLPRFDEMIVEDRQGDVGEQW